MGTGTSPLVSLAPLVPVPIFGGCKLNVEVTLAELDFHPRLGDGDVGVAALNEIALDWRRRCLFAVDQEYLRLGRGDGLDVGEKPVVVGDVARFCRGTRFLRDDLGVFRTIRVLDPPILESPCLGGEPASLADLHLAEDQ